ncbi:uncharacterized protein RAG0_12568 [Rhynchosporium agropyri]|uniref:Uncharacterized protein n=1 Tax=Rhynchosporium agropyri TaxID=914238 RepID=A0A1E1L906_9HELO|nr:uncharacterized protein RAG0_12568 [Rhynchosporium agropyri]
MVLLKDIQGRICTFLSSTECLDLDTTTLVLPKKVRRNMVLVLGGVPGTSNHVKVMPITSTFKAGSDYVPIAPTPKKGYTIQLQLRTYRVWHNGSEERYFQRLLKHSYLKIDSSYEVPTQMLVDVKDHFDNPFMVISKGQGGLRQLQEYIHRRDSIREQEALYRATEKETG